jgi:hypothetical protein
MKKPLMAIAALVAIATTLAVAPGAGATVPSGASIYDRSSAPTVTTPGVAKGRTIRVYVDSNDSKVLSRTSTLYRGSKRIKDWSPVPGAYRVKTVVRYQQRVSWENEVWQPWSDCADYSEAANPGYDDNGDGDYDDWWDEEPTDGFDACAEGQYGDYDYNYGTSLGGTRTLTRWTNVRVAADESPGCVSRAEFRQVKDGMTQAKVHRIFGTRGKVNYSGSGGVGREYVTCAGDEWSYVEVDFNPRVWWKWMYISY